jgi:pyridinium-3,5-bisthiocarboxylic acid mononucleotide nickel chelatase
MKIAIIDCFAGISGDMTLGALINAGLPVDYLTTEIKKLGLSDFEIKIQKTQRHNISATKVDVLFDEKMQPERKYQSIKKIIEDSGLTKVVKRKALDAFKILGEAESKIHDKELNKIHFHEVGAVDSIIDLIASIIGFEYLGIEKIYGMPVPLGTGFTKTEHGMMPVPAPAAIEILDNYPVVHKSSDFEMTTPTGATLLKLLVSEIAPNNLNYKPIKISYGAGSKQTKKWPNLLRLIIAKGEMTKDDEQLLMIEANIDDMNPEIYPYVMERILGVGANDIFLTNIIMKKGRPGTKISVIANFNLQFQIEKILFENTTTIGIRKHQINRTVLPRSSETINTKFGNLNVKVVEINGKKMYRPEYEDCKKLAEEQNINIFEIYRIVESLNNEA